jgi:hypothetical protein
MSEGRIVEVHTECGKVLTRPSKRGLPHCLHCQRDVKEHEVATVPYSSAVNITTHATD